MIKNNLTRVIFLCLIVWACAPKEELHIPIVVKQMIPEEAVSISREIRSKVAAEVDPALQLSLWGVDSLVADPIALDFDEQGRAYITRTNRQKDSEFDIRGHRDWEIGSIKLQTPEERRAFLHRELSPDSSDVNDWFVDLNGDGSRDYHDLKVQKEQVFRIEDVDGDGIADRSQLLAEGFNDIITDPAGALEVFEGNVFMGAGPDMWRLQDLDGDGYFEKQTSISNGYNVHIGFGGHGMSGAEIGPDGRLYWGIGDVGFNGVGPDGIHWKYPNRGVIVRSELDGSNFEVFAMGLRNTHEFVFDKYANLISEDNDGDHPGESERLVYIVEGSDTGWRINWQFGKYNDPKNNRYKVWMEEKLNVPRWDGQAAYILPCIRNYVNGPTGMLYNPGTALGPAWKDHFFIVEFIGSPSNSGIHAFTLKPEGATFAFNDGKKILGGVLPTGIDWGPDGAMYVGDWIEGWGTKDYGRIWKLDDPSGKEWIERKDTEQWIKANFKDIQIEKLSELLGHVDMRIRQKAQFELVKRGAQGHEVLMKAVAQKENQLARVHGIIGAIQMARTSDKKYAAGIMDFLNDSDPEIRAQATKWLGDIKYTAAAQRIVPLLKDESPRVRFFAAEALGRMKYTAAANDLIQMLLENDDKDAYLRHAASLALSRVGTPELLGGLSNHESRSLRLAAVVALRRMEDKAVANFLNDEDVLIVRDAARAINDDWSIEEALVDLGAILNTNSFNDEPIIRRSINANLRVGDEAALKRVMTFASNEENAISLRTEALETLRHWSNPSVLDRVDGRYRGEIQRDPTILKNSISDDLLALLSNKSTTIQSTVAYTLARNGIDKATSQLRDLLSESPYSLVRKAALESLVLLKVEDLADVLNVAMEDKESIVRVAALDAIGAVSLDDTEKLSLLESVIFDKTIPERQSALVSLSKIPASISSPLYNDLLSKWSKGELSPEIRLDVAESIDVLGDEDLIAAVQEIQAKLGSGDLMDQYRDCLNGGDRGRGGRIIWNHTGAQCIRCHEMFDYGGIAGPPLTHIGDVLSPEQILESLVMPNARIAPGYGMVTLIMKDDSEIDGMLLEEKDGLIQIRDAENNIIEVKQEDVIERIDAVSGMTDMKGILTKSEIRDVVAFLSNLKANPVQ